MRGHLTYGIGLGLWLATWLAALGPLAPFIASYPVLMLGIYWLAVDNELPRRPRIQPTKAPCSTDRDLGA